MQSTRRNFLKILSLNGVALPLAWSAEALAASLGSGEPLDIPKEKGSRPPKGPLRRPPRDQVSSPPTDATPTPAPPPTPEPPPASGEAFLTYPYDPVTIDYWDKRPVATYRGVVDYRMPHGSKHTRGAYRPSTKRLYFGWGDHSCNDTGLPEDQGPNSANPAFYSMDPLDPTHIVMEQHRYLTDPNALQPSALDEGMACWNTTKDCLVATSNDAFDQFGNISTSPLPIYVNATTFKMAGDVSVRFWLGQRIRLLLAHPAFPTFVAADWYNVPSWIDCRVTRISVIGGETFVAFVPRTDIPALLFDRDAKGISYGLTQSERGSAWIDNSSVWFEPSTGNYYAPLLEWTPSTRLWKRLDFKMGPTRKGGTTLPLFPKAYRGQSNGCFVPASVTGRGDEVIALDNTGADSGWFGAWIYEYNSMTMTLWVNPAANTPKDYQTGSITRDVPCLDPVGRAIYVFSAPEHRVYAFDIISRTLKVLVDNMPTPTGLIGGCGHSCWNADLGMIEVYCDEHVPGFGCPTLYLVDPKTATYKLIGNTLPNGERLRGDEFYQAGDRTVADGGQFNPDGTDGAPPNRHVIVAKYLQGPTTSTPTSSKGGPQWKQLNVKPMKRVVSYWGDPIMTDAQSTTTEISVPYRTWGGAVVDPITGMMYLCNGGHEAYQGMDVDWCDLSQIANDTMTWTQNFGPPFDTFRRRPHVPPITDPVYGSGGSPYILSDGGDWQCTSNHSYARDTAHPTLGLIRYNVVPANLTVPPAGAYNNGGVIGISSWNPRTGAKAIAALKFPEAQRGGFADWNHEQNKLLIVSDESSLDRTNFLTWDGTNLSPVTTIMRSTAGNGFTRWVHWLEHSTYLICCDGLSNAHQPPRMWLWDDNTKTLSAEMGSDSYRAMFEDSLENVYSAVDRDHRYIWWLVGRDGNAPMLFRSSFDTPQALAQIAVFDNPAFRPRANATISAGHKAMSYYAGNLYFVTSGSQLLSGEKWHAAEFWRLSVFF